MRYIDLIKYNSAKKIDWESTNRAIIDALTSKYLEDSPVMINARRLDVLIDLHMLARMHDKKTILATYLANKEI